ncbi:MAG: helix-turn-helix transcriptional regulator [Clostridiales bacterium]|nr:helix-turn-helix transcriptional regulator [Clostridiales bacterium]
MIFPEKLQILRKSKGLTQEELAAELSVSRQAVAKWESGQGYPDIANLIAISTMFNVTVDYLVKDADCQTRPVAASADESELEALIDFRLEANRNTYAAFSNEVEASRPSAHDFKFEKGEYTYIDTYVGGEQFAGEEAVFRNGVARYAMNYCGRVLDGTFSGDFLKEALRAATRELPYRGPEHYSSGEYTYTCKITGDIDWFQGCEEIFHAGTKVYECFFHGGLMR